MRQRLQRARAVMSKRAPHALAALAVLLLVCSLIRSDDRSAEADMREMLQRLEKSTKSNANAMQPPQPGQGPTQPAQPGMQGGPPTSPGAAMPQSAPGMQPGQAPAQPGQPGQGPQPVPPGQAKPNDPALAAMERVTKRNIFMPEQPKVPPQLAGVLGRLAYFAGNGEGLAVGGEFNGAKVKQIGGDWVEVEFNGQTQKLSVFGPGGVQGPPGGGPPMPPSPNRGGGGGGGPEITPEKIAQFKALPPQVQQQILSSMPPEMRAKVEAALK